MRSAGAGRLRFGAGEAHESWKEFSVCTIESLKPMQIELVAQKPDAIARWQELVDDSELARLAGQSRDRQVGADNRELDSGVIPQFYQGDIFRSFATCYLAKLSSDARLSLLTGLR